ncbi:MAG: chaperone NapD [Deferribacterales bacterium]|jgi:nitrate reductase NapAB chaperone NapD
MIFTGSIITFEEGGREAGLEALKAYPQIEIYASSDDGMTAVAAIETENTGTLEQITNSLKKDENIKDIAHHYMYFGEEVEKMLERGEAPALEELFKSAGIKTDEAV